MGNSDCPNTSGFTALFRSLVTILLVSAISGWISSGERSAGQAAHATDWVRTVDGWESRRVVEAYERSAPLAVHPAVIAGFQLLASLLFLAAFPASVKHQPAPIPGGMHRTHLRQAADSIAVG
jgi:hypothetical protein